MRKPWIRSSRTPQYESEFEFHEMERTNVANDREGSKVLHMSDRMVGFARKAETGCQ
jgi:hypothetical protein